jgi:SAM-dependent methyltransferase
MNCIYLQGSLVESMLKKWHKNWFNSPYYHILYNQQNDREAEYYIDNLCELLKPNADARLLETACGRGRNVVYLNKKGYDVTGIDHSYANVKFAKQFEKERMQFYLHDMRHLLYIKYFDFAFSLFTRFGYFDSYKENLTALKSFNKSLKPDGVLVLDYFNTAKIINGQVNYEVKELEGINFHIAKKIENDKLVKTITFEHREKSFAFREEVKAFSIADFERLFHESNFKIEKQFGDHSLGKYDENKSDRVIFICQKANA